MEKKNNKSIQFIFCVFISILIILNLINLVPISHSQLNDDSFYINSEFKMLENGEIRGNETNATTIDFTLPSESWIFNHTEINFSSIKFKREIYIVEDEIGIYYRELDKQEKALAVQINLTEPTKIYGVHVFGDEYKPSTTTTITVQINGYDSISNQPNNSRYCSTPINMTTTAGWYIMNFSSPIILPKGRYYLVLNGTEMLPQDNAKYHWFQNTLNPNNPDLYIWEYVSGMWRNTTGGIQPESGAPFLYKLDQKVLSNFNPEEHNMSIMIGEDFYPVLNGLTPGTGILSTILNFSPNSSNVTLLINHTSSFSIHFNMSYKNNLSNFLFSGGTGEIKDNDPSIEWTLNPNIQRNIDKSNISFSYPSTWHNLTILRNDVNITLLVTINKINHLLIIPNNVILNGAEWKFTANSSNLEEKITFSNFPTELQSGKELEFKVVLISPITSGTLTFYIKKPSETNVYVESWEISETSHTFNFTIPSNWASGEYTAKIYWNNQTDGGLKTHSLPIEPKPTPFPWLQVLFGTIGGLIGIFAIAIISYKGIKTLRQRHIEERQRLYNQCMDILNLDYIMVTDKKSGLNLYIQNFSEKEIEPSLISGFLQAIHSFGIELIKVEDKTQTIKLEYQDSIVLMTEFVNLRIILLMKETPS
ncbi:MAG: hypothetical protein ACFFCI_10925, partial [Promethearchaeota archaeon]